MQHEATPYPSPVTHSPVKHADAETYVLLSLTFFGLTVAVTRIYLEAAGYPQIGNSVLHIAHALWGGLLLFIAALVTLILANRWALRASAILSGVGVGLFIDEVGKFITQKNDYFFPPAAPLIYACFLLMVLLLLLVRRSHRPSPRASMYRALLAMHELLDNELDVRERDRLLAELENGRASQSPHVALLAEQLTAYLHDKSVPVLSYRPGLWTRVTQMGQRMGERIGRKYHRRFILAMSTMSGISALLLVALLIWSWSSPTLAEEMRASLFTSGELDAPSPTWIIVRLALQLLVGLLYTAALVRLWLKQELAALNTAIFAALLSFSAVNLLNFYLDQFHALAAFGLNLATYFVLLAYREWYLLPQDVNEPVQAGAVIEP